MVPVLANNTLTITSPRACESSKTGCILVMHPVFAFIIVFRLVRDVVANHKTTRYAGAATKVIQKNHLA